MFALCLAVVLNKCVSVDVYFISRGRLVVSSRGPGLSTCQCWWAVLTDS